MKTIGKNIKRLREKTDMSQDELGRRIGKTRSAISQYEAGKIIPRMGVIEDIAEIFSVSKSEILEENVSSVSTCGFTDVPLYGSIAAGTPIEMIEVDDMHPIPAKVRDKFPGSFLLKVEGESMNRVLPNRCYALIEPCEEITCDNDPYAVCINGYNATIKRVKKLANGFQLAPDSTDPTYPVQTFNYNEPGTEVITVIGKVVWYTIPFDWEF